jgi:hypothetical protein
MTIKFISKKELMNEFQRRALKGGRRHLIFSIFENDRYSGQMLGV